MIYRFGLLFLAFFFIWQTSQAQENTKDLIYIVAENFPPFESESAANGLPGHDYEVVQQVFSEIGFVPDINFMPWRRALLDVQSGQAVGTFSCSYTKERAEFIHFSKPISTFKLGFFSKAKRQLPQPTSLEEAKKFDIGSVTGYTGDSELRAFGIHPIEAHDLKSALLMLEAERFDYLYINAQAVQFELEQNGAQADFTFTPIVDKKFHFCFSKNYPKVEKIMKDFDTALEKMIDSGRYQAIHAKYQK